MDFTWLLSLGSPIPSLILLMIYLISSRIFERLSDRAHGKDRRPRRRNTAALAAAGAAFQFFSIAYRPNHAFTAKAQIQQEEDADEDDDGSPETPVKHLHRQLRRIRRGYPVDRLIWRLE